MTDFVRDDVGLCEITGIGRNTILGGAEHRMGAIETLQRGAAGTGVALVAVRIADIAEIAAARPLQNIAAQRRHVAQLRARG